VIYPEIDFMMKRGLSMLPLMAETVEALTFKISTEVVT